MDFGAASRPSPVATQPIASSEVANARSASPLELRPSQTVQSAPAGEAVKLDIRARSNELASRFGEQMTRATLDDEAAREASDREATEQNDRRTVIDEQTRSVVMEERDRTTGERVSQLPNETLLKLRAFARELTDRQRASQAEDTALSRSA